jgi:DNA-binding response OmpR family regulator
MPGRSGIDLCQEIKRRWPGLETRVVFVTGGSFGTGVPAHELDNIFLKKPVTLADIENELAKRTR